MDDSRDWIRRLPKAELHVHLDGSLRPRTMLDLAEDARLELPASEPDALAEAMLVRDVESLEEYLERYRYTVALMQTPAALCRIAWELVEDLADENVRYVETRFCPALHSPGMREEEAIEAVLDGLHRGEQQGGDEERCIARLIVCGLRTLPSKVSERLAELAVRYRDRGVVAFDLAGAEDGFPAKEHAGAFAIAREGGLRRTCHAGEGYGPASVMQALEDCGAERIGHGTRIREDEAVLKTVRDRGVPLEVCVTSNVHTRTVESHEAHPIRQYFDQGIAVTLNTDGRLMDGITLTDEYRTAHERLGFSAEELGQVVLNACEHAFLPDSDRTALCTRVRRQLEETHAA